MKRVYILILFIARMQQVSATNEVPNPGFENWTTGNPDGWFVTNIPGFGIPITQFSPGHSGSYAAKGQPVIVVATGDTLPPSMLSGTPGSGFPISQSYTTLEFYYQCNLTGGDLFSVDVYIYNSSNTVIAASNEDISINASGWTLKSIPINYFGSGTAASAVIQFTILPNPSTGAGYPNPSSTFIVDDVALSGIVGVQENTIDIIRADVFPDPAISDAAINISNSVAGNAELFLYDLKGSVVKQLSTYMTATNYRWKFPVADLPQGIYSVRIVRGKKQWLSRFVKM
jgi:hypothetical protein